MQDINFDFSVLDTLEEIPETSADIEIPDEVLSGPETAEDNGIANLLLDAISNSTNTIQMYNAIIANTTDENLINELNEILVDENKNMGKLQALLQNVSPNAEEIMNGAIEIQGIEDSPIDESLNESKVMSGNQFANWYHYHDGKYNRPKLEKIYAVIDNSISSGVDEAEDLFSQYDCLSQEEKQQITDIINESLDNEKEFNTFKKNHPNYNKNFDNKTYGKFFDKNGKLKPEFEKEFFSKNFTSVEETADLEEALILDESRVFSNRENINQFIKNYLKHHSFDSAEEMIDYLAEHDEIKELEDRFHTDVEAAIEDYFEYLNEALILDESNNIDTALDDVTPVRDVYNERAIRDHKKAKEDRKKAYKEISKNVKDAIELDESLFEDANEDY